MHQGLKRRNHLPMKWDLSPRTMRDWILPTSFVCSGGVLPQVSRRGCSPWCLDVRLCDPEPGTDRTVSVLCHLLGSNGHRWMSQRGAPDGPDFSPLSPLSLLLFLSLLFSLFSSLSPCPLSPLPLPSPEALFVVVQGSSAPEPGAERSGCPGMSGMSGDVRECMEPHWPG